MRILLLLITLLGVAFGATRTVAAEAKLAPGDVIELVISGPELLKERAAIGREGDLSLAKVGTIPAAGLTLAQLRASVREQLATRVFYARRIDGEDRPTTINPEDVAIRVAEYRPIYVNGDVNKPGSQTFRPGMTVRQAISLAGGLDVTRFRVEDPFLDAAKFRAEYETLWIELASVTAKKLRLEAMLAGKKELEPGLLAQTPLPESAVSDLLALQTKRLLAEQSDDEKEARYLQKVAKQLDEQIAALRKREKLEEEGLAADQEEVERTRALLRRGITSTQRTTQARHALLASSTRLLQTRSELSKALQRRAETQRKLERLGDDRRTELMKELQATEVALQTVRARLRGVGEKLLHTGVMKSQLIRGSGGRPEIVVHRSTEAGPKRIEADENAELLPGDVVAVALKLKAPFEALSRTDGGSNGDLVGRRFQPLSPRLAADAPSTAPGNAK